MSHLATETGSICVVSRGLPVLQNAGWPIMREPPGNLVQAVQAGWSR